MMHIYIYIHIALCICIGGLWDWTARSPFGWHDSSSGTLLANGSANSNLLSLLKYVQYLFAYFMVTCCINAQARQLFYRYNCLEKLLKCFFHLFFSLLVIMMNLYWHSLSFTQSHGYIYGTKMSAVISAVTQQDTSNYHGICRNKHLSEARGKWKCPWNLPTLVINKYSEKRVVTAIKPGRIPLHMQNKCTKLVSVRAWVTYMPPIS